MLRNNLPLKSSLDDVASLLWVGSSLLAPLWPGIQSFPIIHIFIMLFFFLKKKKNRTSGCMYTFCLPLNCFYTWEGVMLWANQAGLVCMSCRWFDTFCLLKFFRHSWSPENSLKYVILQYSVTFFLMKNHFAMWICKCRFSFHGDLCSDMPFFSAVLGLGSACCW